MTALLAGLAGALAAAGIVDLAEARATRRPRAPRRPWHGLLVALGRRVGAPRADASLKTRLEAAGAPLALEEVLALKAGAATAAGLATLPLAATAPGGLALVLPAAAAGGAFAAPEVKKASRAKKTTK